MIYSVSFSLVGVVLGLMAVASNPSPYFAALGLVVVSASGCWVIASVGASFLSLVLFLIYIGGMMVVFAYSAAMTAEPYPKAWGNWAVGWYMVVYSLVLGVCYLAVGGVEEGDIVGEEGWSVIRGDWGGISLLYFDGGWLLLIGGLMLLVTLFVVLDMSWGQKGGALRAV